MLSAWAASSTCAVRPSFTITSYLSLWKLGRPIKYLAPSLPIFGMLMPTTLMYLSAAARKYADSSIRGECVPRRCPAFRDGHLLLRNSLDVPAGDRK
ncbi:hypothetical protein AVEN_38912-1 [Araneus ventricosus]|uniref:Uncharacterized protein n=1 Tax=Araneus ventricosus TaxID=182803 RepID=A0A4Y2U6A8_ARAVE|nr:hypothetical protein AVEN_31536-1 [Araneus ventricosus]GBO07243.1 hypothetical protein AVEN_47370-1 [Araneus ventricosus]GBO07250.1 hypothetical protein AVEN_66170-1 [Araneus ventricosus]GBO07276.1 hypothetical protein AVEN_38912-1 [Araneus ventricosus]